jgi:cytochrome c-type biogenesis protein CcmH/NrfG
MDTNQSMTESQSAEESAPSGSLNTPATHMLLLVLLAVIVYANTLQVPFYFDDDVNIVSNPVIRSLSGFFGGDGYEFSPNRFVAFITFTLNYAFGGLNVTGYHLVNLAIHTGNSLLVYTFVRLLMQTPFLRGINSRAKVFIPLVTAVLFTVHPLQTQSVTYIVQRVASLVAFFYLAAIVSHLKWRLAREEGARFFSGRVLFMWVVSLVSALLAMKTKENAFTLPLALLLVECCFFGLPGRQRLLEMAPVLLTIFVIPLTMMNISQLGGHLMSEVKSATEVETLLSRSEYLYTQFGVICRYIGLLFVPIGQTLDYHTGYQASFSLSDPRAFIPLLFLMTLALTAVVLLAKSGEAAMGGETGGSRYGMRLIGFGICWFFLTISVESSIFPISDVYFEHRAYLPSVGFFLCLSALATLAWDRWGVLDKVMVPLVVIVVLLLSGATIARNQLWRDPVAMWQDVKRKSARNPRAWVNLGKEYSVRKMYREAIVEYQGAIEINPRSPYPYNNLGRNYLDLGMVPESIPFFRKANELMPEYPVGRYNLGTALMKLGDFPAAAGELAIAVRLAPYEPLFRTALGGALLMQGRLDEAEREFSQVLQVQPMNNPARAGMQEIARRRGIAAP